MGKPWSISTLLFAWRRYSKPQTIYDREVSAWEDATQEKRIDSRASWQGEKRTVFGRSTLQVLSVGSLPQDTADVEHICRVDCRGFLGLLDHVVEGVYAAERAEVIFDFIDDYVFAVEIAQGRDQTGEEQGGGEKGRG